MATSCDPEHCSGVYDQRMTTAEKEEGILDLRSPWKKIMDGLAAHRFTTCDEEKISYRESIIQTREDYHSSAPSAILDCSEKSR